MLLSSMSPNPTRSKDAALILEGILGFFGFFGVGWLYAGYTAIGLILLLLSVVWWVFALVAILFSAGFGLFCTCPVQILFIVGSILLLNNQYQQAVRY